MTTPIHIFLRTTSAMRRELWRTFLSTRTRICVSAFEEFPPGVPIDVVITDHPVDDATSGKLAIANGGTKSRYDGGVITIGLDESAGETGVLPKDPIVGPASVALPVDATARELKLGVLLLTQIVRNQRAQGAQIQLSCEYQQLAFQDPLTSIANRRAWDQELMRRWDERLTAEGPLCLALLDVDQLKQVNDALGHAEGDAVLRATASALVASVRDQDFVARLGGDEFGVLLADIDVASAHRIVDRIRCSTSRYLATGKVSDDELPVTTSAGYACPNTDETADSLFRRADEALRAAKRAGSNRTMGPRLDGT